MKKAPIASAVFPVVLFFTLITLASCSDKASMPNKAFEGKIIQKIIIHGNALSEMTGESGMDSADKSKSDATKGILSAMNINVDVTMYVKPDKLAYDMSMLGGLVNIHAIIDPMTRKLTMLMPGKIAQQYDLKKMDKGRKSLDDSLNANPTIFDSLMKELPKPTGKKQEINGFDCEEYLLTTEKQGKKLEMEMWITTDPRLKFYDVMRDALLGKGRTGAGGMEQLMSAFEPFAGEGKVPVKMSMKVNGKEFMSSELLEMIEEKLDNKYFEIPKDYKIQETDLSKTKRDSI